MCDGNAEKPGKGQEGDKPPGGTGDADAREALREEMPTRGYTTYSLAQNKQTFEQFLPKALELIAEVDQDNDNNISSKEIYDAVGNSAFVDEDAQIIVFLAKNYREIASLNQNHGSSGLSATDLCKFNEEYKTREQAFSAFTDLEGTGMFDALTGKSKFLTREMIKAQLAKSDNTIPEGALNYLLNNFQKIADASNDEWGSENDGITKQDLDEQQKKMKEGLCGKAKFEIDEVAETQFKGTCYELYRWPDNVRECIKPDAVTQGMIGDCYFIAPLQAVAATRPELISDAIDDNKDGTYSVRFPGDKDTEFTVTAPTQAELGFYAHPGYYGVWANVMEKAYSLYRKSCNEGPQDGNPADGGGYVADVLQLLTGGKIELVSLSKTSQAALADKLLAALSVDPPHAVVGYTKVDNNYNPEKTNEIVGGHAQKHSYSILNFDPDAKSVVLRDPNEWNNKTVQLKTLMDNFDQIIFAW